MLLPWVIGFGVPEALTARSAWPAVATVAVAVAVLLLGLESGVGDAMLAVSVITVPEAVPEGTLRTTGKEAVAPAATVAAVQRIEPLVPAVGVLQLQPEGTTSELNVVLTGVDSVKEALAALAGPLLVTTAVMVRVEPAFTTIGFAVFVMARSALVDTPTVVIAVAELFARLGSVVPEDTLSTSTICVPLVVPDTTVTTTVKGETLETATSGLVHEIVPVPPTAGVVQVQPAAEVIDWKVVFAGMASVKTAFTASRGPLLVTDCV